ncbi:unnamed protein product [Moneuplotes crassus]|uniref:non-specific serine/threonine protein kinase n=2 Tax=Euplotes crassus TaxID=5936 RepID=A0AAD2D788_EUPCR|nr:unnamed protein product [Moneuplotes crassus]
MGAQCCKRKVTVRPKDSYTNIIENSQLNKVYERTQMLRKKIEKKTTLKEQNSNVNEKNNRAFGSTVDSNLRYEGSIQSEEECIKKLGAIRKTYHFRFRDSGAKELTEDEKEIFEYHKLELLGQGEISDVYCAINLTTQEPFVIKTFCFPEKEVLMYHKPMLEAIKHMQKELKSYPMFCPYHQLYLDEHEKDEDIEAEAEAEAEAEGEGELESGTSLTLTMDYMQESIQISESLENCEAFSEKIIRRLVVKVMRALAILQEKGLYHGRLNCNNVYVDQNWNIIMVDYGLMNALRVKNPLTTEEGIRLDILAMGIMILDMLGISFEKFDETVYNEKNVPPNLISFLDTCFEGSIELDDLFIHPFILYDENGVQASPVSSHRTLEESETKNRLNPGSFSSKNSFPGFARKFLTNGSMTSTNKQSEPERENPIGSPRRSNNKNIFYRHYSKGNEILKKDGQNKYSIVSNPNDNELGHFSYYCHEDSKGDKVEFRNSKQVHLKDDPTESDLDSATTPIATSEMKTEFRERFQDAPAKVKRITMQSQERVEGGKQRNTMIQPSLKQLTVLEEASISMEQSREIETESDRKDKICAPLTAQNDPAVVITEQGDKQ